MPVKPKRKTMVQGVGASKLNRDPAGPSVYEALAGLHVGGVPIETLPENMVARLSYQHTDEAIAKRNIGKVDSAARVTAGPLEKNIAHRRDFRREQKEPWEAPDPMKDIAEKYIDPGMSAKFLSPAKVAREGTRGYEVVKDDHGDPVKLGQMVLGVMPKDRSQARRKYYQDRGKQRLQKINQQADELQRAVRDGDSRPFALAGDSLEPGDGLHSDREEDFD